MIHTTDLELYGAWNVHEKQQSTWSYTGFCAL